MLPMAYKGFNRLLLMYINTLWLDALRFINTVAMALGICQTYPVEYVRYIPAKSFEVWLQWDRITNVIIYQFC